MQLFHPVEVGIRNPLVRTGYRLVDFLNVRRVAQAQLGSQDAAYGVFVCRLDDKNASLDQRFQIGLYKLRLIRSRAARR